jgi:hypothetical protein
MAPMHAPRPLACDDAKADLRTGMADRSEFRFRDLRDDIRLGRADRGRSALRRPDTSPTWSSGSRRFMLRPTMTRLKTPATTKNTSLAGDRP